MKIALKWIALAAVVTALCLGAFLALRILNLQGNGPTLHRAAEAGDLVVLRAMLLLGSDIDSAPPPIGLTPLSLAAAGRQIESARLLLALGANPNLPEYQMDLPMTLACENQDREMVALLRKHGAREDIVHAIMQGDNGRVRSMLEASPGLALKSGTPDPESWATIHYAAKAGNLEALTILLRHGANPMVTTRIGQTLVEVAEPSIRDEMITILDTYQSTTGPPSGASHE